MLTEPRDCRTIPICGFQAQDWDSGLMSLETPSLRLASDQQARADTGTPNRPK